MVKTFTFSGYIRESVSNKSIALIIINIIFFIHVNFLRNLTLGEKKMKSLFGFIDG